VRSSGSIEDLEDKEKDNRIESAEREVVQTVYGFISDTIVQGDRHRKNMQAD
jgi:hypothetical protein